MLTIKMLVLVLFVVTHCIAVSITRIDVPPLVESDVESVILDCEYSTGTDPQPGLVVKWFFNGASGLIYQWIPPQQPEVIGLLKGKADLTFRISDEPLQAYRAIKIIRPTTFFTGNYTCVVSTFMAEDRQTRSMLVYSPGKNFRFIQEKKYVFLVTLMCIAEDLYPKPIMYILSQGRPLKQSDTEMEMNSWGLYTVETKGIVHDDEVRTPSEEFVCVLSMPRANYTANRTTVYYPGLMPVTETEINDMQNTQEQQQNKTWTLESPFANVIYTIIIYVWFNINYQLQ